MLIIKKISLFTSAFMPLYFLLLTKIAIELANGNLHLNALNSIMLGLLFFMLVVGSFGIYTLLNVKKCTKITIKSAKNTTETHFLGYISLFVLFALNFKIEYWAMAVSFVLIIIFVGIVYIKNNLFYINPTLNILGYSFFEITYTTSKSQNPKTTYALSKKQLEPDKSYNIYFSIYNINITKS